MMRLDAAQTDTPAAGLLASPAAGELPVHGRANRIEAGRVHGDAQNSRGWAVEGEIGKGVVPIFHPG